MPTSNNLTTTSVLYHFSKLILQYKIRHLLECNNLTNELFRYCSDTHDTHTHTHTHTHFMVNQCTLSLHCSILFKATVPVLQCFETRFPVFGQEMDQAHRRNVRGVPVPPLFGLGVPYPPLFRI